MNAKRAASIRQWSVINKIQRMRTLKAREHDDGWHEALDRLEDFCMKLDDRARKRKGGA